MVYTFTLNPSIDLNMNIDSITEGATNRSTDEYFNIGGKGINVSKMLKNLGIESTAFGFISGFTGEEICRQLDECEIKHDFVSIKKGFSRINIKLHGETETEINSMGPDCSKDEAQRLIEKTEEINNGDIAVFSGRGLKEKDEIYFLIAQKAAENGAKIVCDVSGKDLKRMIKLKPFLVKPNKNEAEEYCGYELSCKDDYIRCLKRFHEDGAENVIISLGKDGAVFSGSDRSVLKCPAAKGKVCNTVGAGDSMVAGFLAGIKIFSFLEKAFMLSCAAGSATAFDCEIAKKEAVLDIFENTKTEEF